MPVRSPASFMGLLAGVLSCTPALADDTTTSGRDGYLQHCAACHLESGQGVPSAFPPLDGRLGRWAGTDDGRNYLVSVVSKGLFGPITVNGTSYVGAMPQMSHIDPGQTAGILSYVVSEFGGATDASFTADEVTARREQIGAAQSRALRPGD